MQVVLGTLSHLRACDVFRDAFVGHEIVGRAWLEVLGPDDG